jgi:hypothetical protein
MYKAVAEHSADVRSLSADVILGHVMEARAQSTSFSNNQYSEPTEFADGVR